MAVYYNEFDKSAAAWLRELIADGVIPAGDVDERSICDVQASDLKGYCQCHFFAGIGGWAAALRLAGVPDDFPVWTGSCPCPPFSCAGKKKRCPKCGGRTIPHPLKTGVFACVPCGYEWHADGRHLWPEFLRLITDGRPTLCFGEQVGGEDGRIWLAGVRATLEALGYGVWSKDTCAASVGAPHIRQRLYWVAESATARCAGRKDAGASGGDAGAKPSGGEQPERGVHVDGVADDNRERCDGQSVRLQPRKPREASVETAGSGEIGGLADGAGGGLGIDGGARRGAGHADERGQVGGLADTERDGGRRDEPVGGSQGGVADGGIGPWSNYTLLPFRDGKQRRIEPGLEPLVDGAARGMVYSGDPGPSVLKTAEARAMRLKGYGNCICVPLAAEFIRAFCA